MPLPCGALPCRPRIAMPMQLVPLTCFPIASLSKVLPLHLFASLCHSFASPRIALPMQCCAMVFHCMPSLIAASQLPRSSLQSLCSVSPRFALPFAHHWASMLRRCTAMLRTVTHFFSAAVSASRCFASAASCPAIPLPCHARRLIAMALPCAASPLHS